jgi:hypothetical protein
MIGGSPRFTWADIKTFDGYAIQDGTDMRSIFKSLTNTGAADFPLLGNDVSLPLAAYAHPLAHSGDDDHAFRCMATT